jgi:hypothetical protein
MKLVERLQKFSRVILLSATISSAFVGCATPWQNIRMESTPGIERKVVLSTTNEKLKEIGFNILDPYKEGRDYKVKIEENANEINSLIQNVGIEKKFREINIQTRKVSNTGPGFSILGSLLGCGGGLALGNAIAKDSALVKILGGSLGLSVGLGLGYLLDITFSSEETRRIATGTSGMEIGNKKTEETVTSRLLYKNLPAMNISVMITSDKLKSMLSETSSLGAVNLSDYIETDNPQYFFRAYSDEETEKRIAAIPLVQQIKPAVRDLFVDRLKGEFSKFSTGFTIRTDENSTQFRKVYNTSKNFKAEVSQLTDETIYETVKQFVDEEINSHIKSLTFVVKDNISHIPIRGSNFEFKVNAPRKEDLAEEYFVQDLKDYAQECIWDYIEGDKIVGDCPETVSFNIYAPSSVQIEVTNPNYNFVSGLIVMDNENLEKKVYMVDKGSKIRVQGTDNETGWIE